MIDGISLANLSGVNITCSSTQFLTISPPIGITCGEYLAPYLETAGGMVMNPTALTSCQYCPISNADSFLHGDLEIGCDDPWNNVGYLAAFVAFNVVAKYALYWLARVPRKRGEM
jgi:ATP-binding cassette, subfamily G (WHITE), member 2, PDR